MIRKGGRSRLKGGFEICVMKGYRDKRGDERVRDKERGDEETVKAGRPGVRRGRVFGDVVESVGGVRGFINIEVGLEVIPESNKRGGGESGVEGSGVIR